MKFKEQFPSLEGKLSLYLDCTLNDGEYIRKEAVIKHCLDKQRMTETIKKLPWKQINNEAYIKINDLIKESGLE